MDLKISAPEGSFQPWFSKIRVLVEGATSDVKSVTVDGKTVEGARKEGHTILVPAFAAGSSAHSVHFAYR